LSRKNAYTSGIIRWWKAHFLRGYYSFYLSFCSKKIKILAAANHLYQTKKIKIIPIKSGLFCFIKKKSPNKLVAHRGGIE